MTSWALRLRKGPLTLTIRKVKEMNIVPVFEKYQAGERIIFYVCNCAVWRGLGMLADTQATFDFLPTSTVGYVVLDDQYATLDTKPKKAWVLFQPKALRLSWDKDITVDLVKMSEDNMQRWYLNTGQLWPHYKQAKR